MKIVFMGTPDFAVPSLKALIDEYGVQSVFTQPDKRQGRGKKIAYSPVKEEALKHDIKVLQPVKLKDEKEMIQELKDLKPDFIIVVAFGQLLTKEVLDIPKYGCINLHGSLLPMYRGAAPINWAIINGEKKSGNTTMLMDVGLDTGDMLLKDEVEITDNMIAGELYDTLKERGSKLLIDTIKGVVDGTITPEKQTDETFYAKMLNKEMANIDWTKSAKDINNFIRGLNPWPVAFTKYEDKVMKIYEAEVIGGHKKAEAGCITKVSKEGLEIACGEGSLLVKKIQFPGKKALTVREYLNGYKIEEGTTLTK